eukprot:865193-Pleurochrysis_carterae.AAC.1
MADMTGGAVTGGEEATYARILSHLPSGRFGHQRATTQPSRHIACVCGAVLGKASKHKISVEPTLCSHRRSLSEKRRSIRSAHRAANGPAKPVVTSNPSFLHASCKL